MSVPPSTLLTLLSDYGGIFAGSIVFIAATTGVILLVRRTRTCRRKILELQSLCAILQGVLNAAPEGILLTDLDGHILFSNKNLNEFRYCETAALPETSIYNLLPPASADARRQAMAEAMDSGSAVTYQDQRGGRVLETHVCPVRDGKGVIVQIAAFWVDITERHVTEQQLRDSEEKFWAIAHFTPDGESWYSPEGRCLWMNPGVEQLTGYQPELFLEKQNLLFDILHPADRDMARTHFMGALQGSLGQNLELRCIRADKHEIWLGVSWQPMFDHGGTFLGTRISARDITSMKRIEKQLSLQSLVLDQISDAVTVTDLNGIILYVNQAEMLAFQRSLDDLIGKPIALYGQNREALQVEIIRQTLEQGEWKGQLLRPDEAGKTRYFDCRTTLVHDKQWKPIGMCSIATDITDREQAQQALLESEARFRGVFETSPTGIVLAEAGTLRLLSANPSFLNIIGYDQMDVPRLSVADFTHPDDWATEKHVAAANRNKTNGQFEFEKRFIRKDGDLRWVHVRGAYLPTETDIPLVIGTVTDITDRKIAEEALRASLKEKEVLLREVHHRVKNNLAAIIGLLDIQCHSLTDAGLRLTLEELSGRIRSMSLIHENLYQSLSMAEIDFQAYTRDLIRHLLVSFGSPRIHCDVDMPDITLPLDQALPCGMILNELMTNVFKYAFPDETNVSARVAITLRRTGDTCILRVTDNGVGLPAGCDWREVQSLGMVLIRTLGQHQLGGKIEVDTEHGVSCTLTFHSNRRSIS